MNSASIRLFGQKPQLHKKARLTRGSCAKPLAGEGGSRVSTTRLGEGCSAPLHPNVPDRTPALPSPAREGGTSEYTLRWIEK